MRHLLALLLLVLAPGSAFAWNALGHKVIADIAWRHLDDEQRAEIIRTLRRHPRFDEDFVKRRRETVADEDRWIFQHAATWPDLARGLPAGERGKYDRPTWHYINLPVFLGDKRPVKFNTSIDTAGQPNPRVYNIAQAIAHVRGVLASDAPPDEKAVAYCWLFHLVGDLHQPMHAVALVSERMPAGDRGGNTIPLRRGDNLHSLWDNLLGRQHRMEDVAREVAELRRHPEYWQVGTAADVPKWIDESRRLAESFAYDPIIREAVARPGDLPPIELPEEYLREAGDHARRRVVAAGFRLAVLLGANQVEEMASVAPNRPTARIDGTELGWRELGEADFVDVNCEPETWEWREGELHCSGQPVGVIRSRRSFTNFELMAQWRHLRSSGNSGIFVWTDEAALRDLKPGSLPPGGIEVQVLDHGYTAEYERTSGKKADWFTTNGDVFPVGSTRMKPFPPISPDGSRSFPRKQLSKGVGVWNHYYIRCLNGEVRLWVNGEEVSGGSDCQPRSGYICLESEGAPIEFKHLRIREIP